MERKSGEPTKDTMLIVDDEIEILELLSEFVRGLGYSVICATNSDHAMKLLLEQPVTAVLSDISMPGDSGLEFLRRSQTLGVMAPFAFLTGHGSIENVVAAVRMGAVDFAFKPFEESEIKNLATRLMGIGQCYQQTQEILEELGHAVAPQSREILDQLRREIGLLRITKTRRKAA